MAKDKEKVVDEVWTEGRIRQFLDVLPADQVDPDFHRLQKAYQQMRAEDFDVFVGLFVENGGNINAIDRSGRTLLSYVSEHRNSSAFAETLRRHGAA